MPTSTYAPFTKRHEDPPAAGNPPLATPSLRRPANLFQKPQLHMNLLLRPPMHQPALHQQWLPPMGFLPHTPTEFHHDGPIQRPVVFRAAGENQHEDADFEAGGVVRRCRDLAGARDDGRVEGDDCLGRDMDGFEDGGLRSEDELPVVGEVDRAFVEWSEREGAGVRYGGGAGGGDVAGENIGGGDVGEGDICGKGQDGEGRESERQVAH